MVSRGRDILRTAEPIPSPARGRRAVSEAAASHAVYVSQPAAVAGVIAQAAGSLSESAVPAAT